MSDSAAEIDRNGDEDKCIKKWEKTALGFLLIGFL